KLLTRMLRVYHAAPPVDWVSAFLEPLFPENHETASFNVRALRALQELLAGIERSCKSAPFLLPGRHLGRHRLSAGARAWSLGGGGSSFTTRVSASSIADATLTDALKACSSSGLP